MSSRSAARPVDPLVVDLAVDLLGSAPRSGRRRGDQTFWAVPGPAAPRHLVALGQPGAAALGRHLGGCSAKARARRAAVRLAVRTGVVPPGAVLGVAPGQGEIGGRLAELLGQETRVALVVLGPPRANRKPVVALTDPDGGALAFVKLGHDPLTADLVARERRALGAVVDPLAGAVHVPRPLGGGTWAGREVSVTAPMPVAACATPPRSAVLDLVRRVQATAALGAPEADPLSGALELPQLAALAPVVRDLLAARADVELGAWHGDLHAGNVAWGRDSRIIAWDWERWEAGVPLGMDLLHHDLQSWVRGGLPLREAADRALAEAPDILAPLGVAAAAATVAAREYLVRVAWRYARDRQSEAGARTGAVESWAVPALLGPGTRR